jgi:patatin-related protein
MHSDSNTRARTSAGAPADPAASMPALEVAQEVRFAVVMYGGVSLAIYINGVTQEMLRLVQATAPAEKDGRTARPLPLPETPGQPGDTTWTYRKLAYLLADDELRADYRVQLARGPVPPEEDLVEQAMRDPERALRTRFIIDILSGTSAGGINAVFLAKSLAGNRDMDALRELWVSEGDMALLLNDKGSLAGLGLPLAQPPQSLLNSQRMYAKLLQALDAVDGEHRGTGACDSPCVDELDLFVTVTDLAGVPLPIGLSDRLVYERRHRNVFQFKYATDPGRNDFEPDNNPFLAFASRCTSAFPFAFEPMSLRDIDAVLARHPNYGGRPECRSDSPRWKRFFKEVPDPRTGRPGVDFTSRAFADGGYLDNKPFSYATETMLRRHADVMVDRKLIYIEPNPAHPEDAPLDAAKPDALANVKAATMDLPTYETIREDLQRVLDRNRLIERINRLIQDIEQDIELYDRPGSPHAARQARAPEGGSLGDRVVQQLAQEQRGQEQARPRLKHGEWDEMGLAGMIDKYGIYYLPYRRLRVAAVTDDLAELIARRAGFDEQSDYLLAIRCLVRSWRLRTYKDNPEPGGEKTVNQYLTEFDFHYRLRRLIFLRQKLAELLRLAIAAARKDVGEAHDASEQALLSEIQKRLHLPQRPRPEELAALAKILTIFKQQINARYMELRRAGRELRRRASAAGGEGDERGPALHVRNLGIQPHHLEYILGGTPAMSRDGKARTEEVLDVGGRDGAACEARADAVLDRPEAIGLPSDLLRRLGELAGGLREFLRGVMRPNKQRTAQLLDERAQLPVEVLGKLGRLDGDPLVHAVRHHLWHYFDCFEDYDQIRFPILYETDVGEADMVEVIRISPEDATSLVDEQAEARKGLGQSPRRKLAGTALRNFGAFLDPAWRENDIMWGRLDGAERLITSLLPEPRDACIRAALIEEAHMTILAQTLPGMHQTMADIRARVHSGEAIERVLERALKEYRARQQERREAQRPDAAPAPDPAQRPDAAPAGVDRRALLAYMRTEYTVSRKLDNKAMLRLVSRSSQVAGQMFEDIARQHRIDSKGVAWIARFGQLMWGLIEVSSADSIVGLLWRRWLTLLYAFEGLMTLGAWLLGYTATQRFGLAALGITFTVHLLVLVFGDLMAGNKKWRRVAMWLGITGVVVCALVGLHRMTTVGAAEAVREILTPVLGGASEDEPEAEPAPTTSLPRP